MSAYGKLSTDLEAVLASLLADCARECGDQALYIEMKGGHVVQIMSGAMTREELSDDYGYTHRVTRKIKDPPAPLKPIRRGRKK